VRIVLDTNVFVSGVFFSGPPHKILKAWRDNKVKIVASAEIIEEYRRVGEELANRFSGVDLEPFLVLLAVEAEVVIAPALPEPVCEDTDDDKFFACALAGGCELIVSGDRHVKQASGYRGVVVKTPRKFVEENLKK
jgi:putative PIN family toxin of toxin-antitoxin system